MQFLLLFLKMRSLSMELTVQLLIRSSTSLRLCLSPKLNDSKLSRDIRAPSTDSLQLLFIKDLIILATPLCPSSSHRKGSLSLVTPVPTGRLLIMLVTHLTSKPSSLTYQLNITINVNNPSLLSTVTRKVALILDSMS